MCGVSFIFLYSQPREADSANKHNDCWLPMAVILKLLVKATKPPFKPKMTWCLKK